MSKNGMYQRRFCDEVKSAKFQEKIDKDKWLF